MDAHPALCAVKCVTDASPPSWPHAFRWSTLNTRCRVVAPELNPGLGGLNDRHAAVLVSVSSGILSSHLQITCNFLNSKKLGVECQSEGEGGSLCLG